MSKNLTLAEIVNTVNAELGITERVSFKDPKTEADSELIFRKLRYIGWDVQGSYANHGSTPKSSKPYKERISYLSRL